MFASLKNSFSQGKDALAAKTLIGLANQRLAGVGSVLDLGIDSQAKSLSATVQLEGESITVQVGVGRYELVESAGGLALRLSGVTASRPWALTLAQWFLEGRSLPLPPDIPPALVRMAL